MNHSTFVQIKERLEASEFRSIAPFLISFCFVLIFSGTLTPSLNPRLGARVDVPAVEGEHLEDGGIRLSITANESHVFVKSENSYVFSWPINGYTRNDLAPFISYLEGRVVELITKATLARNILQAQTSVILAVDQHLQFGHVLGILYGMAEAGISEYGFETLAPNVTTTATVKERTWQ